MKLTARSLISFHNQIHTSLKVQKGLKALFLCLVTFIGIAYASDVGISPPRLELTGRPGQTVTETVTLFTTAPSQQQISVEMSDWTLSPEGGVVFLPIGSAQNSASPWLALETDDFLLEPEGARDVRLSVTLPDDPNLKGTYQGIVFFRVIPPDSAVTGVGVVTTTRVGLVVYITVTGTEQAGSEFIDLYQENDESLTVVVANTGNTLMRVGGVVELRGEDGETKHRLEVPDVAVLRESERGITLPLEGIEGGFYVALALLEDSRGGLLVGELPIEVPVRD